MVDPGNLIKADDTILTSIVSQDPMYVYFPTSTSKVRCVQRLIREDKVSRVGEGSPRHAGSIG